MTRLGSPHPSHNVLPARPQQAFRPAEPHIVPFLHLIKGFSNDTILLKIFPHGLYAYFLGSSLLPALMQLVGLRNILIAGGVFKIITRIVLIKGTTLASMIVVQYAYGMAMACDVAMIPYALSVSPATAEAVVGGEGDGAADSRSGFFQGVTSTVKATGLVSFLLASASSQVLLAQGASEGCSDLRCCMLLRMIVIP